MAWVIRKLSSVVICSMIAGAGIASELKTFQNRQPTVAWVKPVGEIDKQIDEVDGISVDNNGNTVISGVFRNQLSIGGKMMKSRGKGDIFLASIAQNGKTTWSLQIGGSGDDNTFDLTTDKAGNIYASGWFSGEVDFGGQKLKSNGGTDHFVAKYSPSGQLIWAPGFGGSDEDGGNEISVLDNGEIAVSAITNGTFEAGGKSYKFGGGNRDSLVLRLTPEGKIRWVAHFDGSGTERIRALAMAPSGDVYLGFQYRGTLRGQGETLQARGDWDGAVARLDNLGKLVWLKPVGSKGTDSVRGIGVSPDGAIYASGFFGGPGILIDREVPAPKGRQIDYVVRLDSSGAGKMVISLIGAGRNLGPELQADNRGVILSAMQKGTLTIRRGSKVVAELEPPASGPTSYVVALDPSGELRFAFTPTPVGGKSGAFGDVLSVSRNGQYLVQALRFRGEIQVNKESIETPAEKDSAVVFMRMNGS